MGPLYYQLCDRCLNLSLDEATLKICVHEDAVNFLSEAVKEVTDISQVSAATEVKKHERGGLSFKSRLGEESLLCTTVPKMTAFE